MPEVVEAGEGRTARIVVVDDDPDIRELVRRALVPEGFAVTTAGSGAELRAVLATGACDLIVLDVMLPGENGLEICRALRRTSSVPIIMLTVLAEEGDRVAGLDVGADDYLAKPFGTRELIARIRAVLRRAGGAAGPGAAVYRFAGWTLDTLRRRLTSPEGAMVRLTAGEYDLLVTLLEHPGQVLSRDRLAEMAKGRMAHLFDRSIDIQVGRLRRKIEPDPKEPTLIQTVRTGGYILSIPVEREG